MRLSPVPLCVLALLAAIPLSCAAAQSRQSQQSNPSTPTIKVTSALVFLDVTVLDKKGNPVVTGLTKDDFTITEDTKPQRIFSVEAPEAHVMSENAKDEHPNELSNRNAFRVDLSLGQ